MRARSHLGKDRAGELLSVNQDAGPARGSLADYVARVHMQSVAQTKIKPIDVERAFLQMVLDPATLTRLGTAVSSGASIFLYGPTGTGKPTIASCIPAIFNDSGWIPHSREVENQISKLQDPGGHPRSYEP